MASQIALRFFSLKQIVAKCQEPHIFPMKQSLKQPGHFKLCDLQKLIGALNVASQPVASLVQASFCIFINILLIMCKKRIF